MTIAILLLCIVASLPSGVALADGSSDTIIGGESPPRVAGSSDRLAAEPSDAVRKGADESSAADDLDAALLEELDDELSDDLMEELVPPKGKPLRQNRAVQRRDGNAKSKPADFDPLQQRLDEEAETPGQMHPLARIGAEMQRAEALIRRQVAAAETQALQEKIVDDLDKLIREAQQKSRSSSSQKQARQHGSRRDRVRQPNQQPVAGNTPGQQPPRDSENRVGSEKPAEADPKAVRKMMEELWGHLPERLRQQVINASVEEFLPKYELQLEQYFRRLAEEMRDAP